MLSTEQEVAAGRFEPPTKGLIPEYKSYAFRWAAGLWSNSEPTKANRCTVHSPREKRCPYHKDCR